MRRLFWQGALIACCGLMLVACGGGEDSSISLEPIKGIYKTDSHLINPDNCSQDGTDYAETPMAGAIVWHDAYFQLIDGFMVEVTGDLDLDWCPDATGTGCSFSMISVAESSNGWYKEHVQAGGQAGFDCENLKTAHSATLLEDGRLRLEHRIFRQNVPEGSSDCNLSAAKALEGDEYCGGYEVIVGSLVE
jgi:hypothetical protein